MRLDAAGEDAAGEASRSEKGRNGNTGPTNEDQVFGAFVGYLAKIERIGQKKKGLTPLPPGPTSLG